MNSNATNDQIETSMIEDAKNNMIGNPFGPYAPIKMKADGSATQAFMDWLIGNKHTDVFQNYRSYIINNINKWKGKQINYYTNLNRPSHATVLDYMINEHNWNKQTQSKQIQSNQLSLFTESEMLDYNSIIQLAKSNNKELTITEEEYNNMSEEVKQHLINQIKNC